MKVEEAKVEVTKVSKASKTLTGLLMIDLMMEDREEDKEMKIKLLKLEMIENEEKEEEYEKVNPQKVEMIEEKEVRE